MKNTIKVFIASLAFNIVSSAYKKIKDYLNNVEDSLIGSDSAKEVLEDIEHRIAELLNEKSKNAEVVNDEMVDQVIEIIDSSTIQIKDTMITKKLFRDTKEKVIAGVCSGLSAYWGVDPVLIRVIFIIISVLLSIFVPCINLAYCLLGYLLLWIITPAAKSDIERKRMQAKNRQTNKNKQKESSSLVRLCCVFIGVLLIFITLICLVLILLCSLGIIGFPFALISSFSGIFGPGTIISLSLVVSIPLLLFLYWGILLTFNIKKPSWKAGFWSIPIWIISIVVCIISSLNFGANYTKSERYKSEIVMEAPSRLVINLENADKDYDYAYYRGDINDYQLVMIDNKTCYAYPTIHIERVDSPQLKIKSTNRKFKNADSSLEFLTYNNDTLSIRPMVFSKDIKTTQLSDDIIIELPSDCEIKLNSVRTHDFKSEQEYSNILGWPRK